MEERGISGAGYVMSDMIQWQQLKVQRGMGQMTKEVI